jgi:hypothetical protein
LRIAGARENGQNTPNIKELPDHEGEESPKPLLVHITDKTYINKWCEFKVGG